MKKIYIRQFILSAVIMFLPPWLAVTFIKGDAGMAVCFLLFFAINPVYSIFTGIFAGKSIRYLWSLPIASAALFLLGAWVFFDMGEVAFIMYAGIYLLLGMIAMLISSLARKRNKN